MESVHENIKNTVFCFIENALKVISFSIVIRVSVGAQLRSQPILRWAIAQLRILSWVAYLKMGFNASQGSGNTIHFSFCN